MKHELTTGKLFLNYGEENETVLGEITIPTPEPELYNCFCTTCGINFESEYHTNVCCYCFNKYIKSGDK